MQTEPEVLTDHTDMICSTSIERIVSGRNTALMQIEALIHQLDEISTLTSSIGGGGSPLRLLVYRKSGSRDEGHHPQYRSQRLA